MNVTEEISRYLAHKIPHAYMIETRSDGLDGEEVDDTLGLPLECLARSEAVNIDGRICMVVIPATKQVDLEKLRKYMGAREVRPATEADYKPLFPAGENGAIPIFGSLYGIQVLVAQELMDYQEITFIVGAFQVIVHIRLRDFLVKEKPYVCARNAISSEAQKKTIQSVVVYQLNEETMRKEPVGTLVERRKVDRGDNVLGMLRLARKEFKGTEADTSIIAIGDFS